MTHHSPTDLQAAIHSSARKSCVTMSKPGRSNNKHTTNYYYRTTAIVATQSSRTNCAGTSYGWATAPTTINASSPMEPMSCGNARTTSTASTRRRNVLHSSTVVAASMASVATSCMLPQNRTSHRSGSKFTATIGSC